jgi:hypothetical protein
MLKQQFGAIGRIEAAGQFMPALLDLDFLSSHCGGNLEPFGNIPVLLFGRTEFSLQRQFMLPLWPIEQEEPQ